MKNYIGISRCIVDHWIYQDAEYFKTWFEMLYRARWKDEDKQELIEGQLVIIKRGYFIFGRQGWSKRIGISEQRLRTLIKKLINENMIELIEVHNKFTIYSIINYEKYNLQSNLQETQENKQFEGYSNLQNNQQSTFNQPSTNLQLTTKEEREDRGKKEKNIYSEEFEEFYSLYPNPFNKVQTFKNWIKLLKNETVENIMKATNNYIRYIKVKKIDEQYIVRSTNFIGQKEEYKAYLEVSIQTKERTGVKADNTKLIRREDY